MAMFKPIKILHINPRFEVVYCLIQEGVFLKSRVALDSAVSLLKNEEFDLIISEPHHTAILKEQAPNYSRQPQ
jgi:hypothetical protein